MSLFSKKDKNTDEKFEQVRICGLKMNPVNIIRITKIATVLQALPGNNVVGGEPGIALVRAEQMHNFGKNKSGEIK